MLEQRADRPAKSIQEHADSDAATKDSGAESEAATASGHAAPRRVDKWLFDWGYFLARHAHASAPSSITRLSVFVSCLLVGVCGMQTQRLTSPTAQDFAVYHKAGQKLRDALTSSPSLLPEICPWSSLVFSPCACPDASLCMCIRRLLWSH
jgi:hypothetical protein